MIVVFKTGRSPWTFEPIARRERCRPIRFQQLKSADDI
jgi:hypothetical protein